MLNKTYKSKKGGASQTHKTRKTKPEIQHHHLLIRMETKKCPEDTDKPLAIKLIRNIIHDVNMKLLADARVFYMEYPRYNEGLTALAPIKTSHIAFHFWKRPERHILKNANSRCLLQFDIYTCGALTQHHIQKLLHHLSCWKPTHCNATLLNRKYSLTIERQMVWDSKNMPWAQWVDTIHSAE